MADKIVVMNAGNVEQIGAPLELYDRPTNLFVAGFIGSPAMNFLKGRVEGGAFHADGGTALPLPRSTDGSDGKPAVYGVRPEHFQLNPDGLPAKVHVVEPTGSETQVLAEFAGASVLCCLPRTRLRQTGRNHPHHARFFAGASVRCRHRTAACRLTGSMAEYSRQTREETIK